jgi:hypothetical protein
MAWWLRRTRRHRSLRFFFTPPVSSPWPWTTASKWRVSEYDTSSVVVNHVPGSRYGSGDWAMARSTLLLVGQSALNTPLMTSVYATLGFH